MNMTRHCRFTWKVVVIIFGYWVALSPGWAHADGKKPVPSEVALNVSTKDPGIPERPLVPNFALIEQVQATGLDQHVQVRVVGNGPLSCTPFPLTGPDRLVLDCTGAQVQARLSPSRVNLDPVLSVRVGQFKTNVARVVVELASRTPYTIRAEGNVVIVDFDSLHRRPPILEPKSKPLDSSGSSVERQADQVVPAVFPTVPDKLPVPQLADVTSPSPTLGNDLPLNRAVSTPALVQPVPQKASE